MDTAKFSLSVDDYIAYNQRLCSRRIGRVLAIAIAIVAVLSIVEDGVGGIRGALAGAAAGGAAFGIYIFVIVPRSARTLYSEQVSMSEERTLSVDHNGAEFSQPSGVFRIAWANVVQWDETARLLTLFVNRAVFLPITKPQIGEDLTAKIRGFLIHSGLPKPMRRRSAK